MIKNKNIAIITSKKILNGFEQHYKAFKKSSIKAKIRFEKKQWKQLVKESKQRIYFYDNRVKKFCEHIEKTLDINLFDESLWTETKLAFTSLVSTHKQPELAETFYNSVFCCLFDKRFYNNKFIFVKPSIATEFIDMDNPVTTSYYIENRQFNNTIKNILTNDRFTIPYENFERDSKRLKQQLIQRLRILKNDSLEIQIINSLFFRRKAAYIVGKIISNNNKIKPLLIAITNKKNLLYVDALLTDVNDLSIVFSFSRSYFFINTNYPAAVVNFLKSIMPSKTKAELYSSIGLHKHGKTLLYRIFLQYSKITKEKLIIAPGVKGMVMTVFTFPMFPYVFKVINDVFTQPKTSNPKIVKAKYFFVKNHGRVGRLADTWEFSNVAFPINYFDDKLLKELKEKTTSSITIEGNLLIVKHLYMENKMIPLNLYLNTATDKQLEHIINDYGKAIDELINANIFPGDMLTKNFGVTRQNRVVFYDYDEITPMDKPVFKKIPVPKNEEEAMASKPWYYVGDDDVFPEEFKFFMFSNNKNKKILNQNYKKLLNVNYWQQVQKKLKQGKVENYYPYKHQYRMGFTYKNK